MGTVVLVFVQSAWPDLVLVETTPFDRFTVVVGKKCFVDGNKRKENIKFYQTRMHRTVISNLTSKAEDKWLGARLNAARSKLMR